jgi:ABC-type phosphate/phosphonate transport system substrate-binding protein
MRADGGSFQTPEEKETVMASIKVPVRSFGRGLCLRAFAIAAVLSIPFAAASGRQGKPNFLHIGTSRPLSGERNEKSSLETLRAFIKDETGLDSEITQQKDWSELAQKMSKGQLEVGVFQGYEFAYAKEKYPDLKPLAVAVNVYVYPVAYVVTRKEDKIQDFAGLQGKSLAMVNGGAGFLQLFVQRQSEAAGKKMEAFFSKIVSRENYEDVLDDVVDGAADAAVVERAALEAYKRRKPGRFNHLRPVVQSKPFPPAVVASYGNFVDEETRNNFRDGLLNAANKEKGQTMLTLFRLTGFQTPPPDFDKVLAETRAAYPPEGSSK